jgi:hypothetical protein
VLPNEVTVLTQAILVRAGRLLDLDRLADMDVPADRCLLVAVTLQEVATEERQDPLLASVMERTGLVAALKAELMTRRTNDSTRNEAEAT